MKNIENKIYALKDGDHPGIYMSWLDFYPEAEKLELFYSKSFEYQESLIRGTGYGSGKFTLGNLTCKGISGRCKCADIWGISVFCRLL